MFLLLTKRKVGSGDENAKCTYDSDALTLLSLRMFAVLMLRQQFNQALKEESSRRRTSMWYPSSRNGPNAMTILCVFAHILLLGLHNLRLLIIFLREV